MISDEQWARLEELTSRSRVKLEAHAKHWTDLTTSLQFRDRDGDEITMGEALLLARDPHYKTLAETTLSDDLWVSTVWLGWLGYDGARFETGVFRSDDDVDIYRSRSEAAALATHDEIVKMLRETGTFRR